jgi:arylsulfatase
MVKFTNLMVRTELLAGSTLLALAVTAAPAQQVTGVPGSPSATTTIEGNQLPPPP